MQQSFLFFRRRHVFVLEGFADDVRVQVHGNDDVGAERTARGHRHRVDEAAVDEPFVIDAHGGKQPGQRHRCPDPLGHAALS